jgi:hypothetical protein
MTRALMAALLASLPIAAPAQDAPLAELWTNNGSLPPEYAWEATVTISTGGQLILRRCAGYETEGDACTTRRARVPDDQLQAIRDAVAASGLLTDPAQQTEEPTVGGGLTGGRVWLEGTEIALPPQPATDDVTRVQSVLAAIQAAVPARFGRDLGD